MAFKSHQLRKGPRDWWSNRKKEWRMRYIKSKSFDTSCRNHGSCSYCQENRTFSSRKRVPITSDEEYTL